MSKYNKKSQNITRKKVLLFLSKIKIKSLNFSFSQILSLTGIMLIITSLFIPWFLLPYNTIAQGAFSKILGIHGIIIVIIVAINLFFLFSQSLKQKLKLLLGKSLYEGNFMLISSLILLLFIINSLSIVSGLQIITSEITYFSGIFLNLAGTVTLFVASLFQQKKESQITNFVSLNESSSRKEEEKNKKRNVTKLPF